MIENLQDKLYQLEKKQAKDVKKLYANTRWEMGGKKKKFLKGLERQNL